MRPTDAAGPDALVMAAAVADFTPAAPAERKIPRSEGLSLELTPTPDLLAEVAAHAAEAARAGSPAPSSSGSRPRPAPRSGGRQADAPRASTCSSRTTSSEPGSGFGTETNRVTILDRAGAREELPLLPKREVADRILDRVAHALDARDAAEQTAGMQRGTRS